MFTGELYGFYSNKSLKTVFENFKLLAKGLGYEHNNVFYEGEESFLFYKSETMLNHHLENGYNIDIDDEGCFSIEGKKTKLHGIATLIEFENESNFDPYNVNLTLNDVFYYVLTLPRFIEDSQFSLNIHNRFVRMLGKANTSE